MQSNIAILEGIFLKTTNFETLYSYIWIVYLTLGPGFPLSKLSVTKQTIQRGHSCIWPILFNCVPRTGPWLPPSCCASQRTDQSERSQLHLSHIIQLCTWHWSLAAHQLPARDQPIGPLTAVLDPYYSMLYLALVPRCLPAAGYCRFHVACALTRN